ncbi:DUF402 domain-containing protein [Paenibacillus rhizoplanae]
MFDEQGQIVQWYVDICYRNGVSEDNVPWMDDLFLDIIVLPSGAVIQKDSEELDEALLQGRIDSSLYNLARQEADFINSLIKDGKFTLLQLSEQHQDILVHMLQKVSLIKMNNLTHLCWDCSGHIASPLSKRTSNKKKLSQSAIHGLRDSFLHL